jgi:chromosome segregation ATPase
VVRSISSEFGLNAKYNGSNLHTLSEGQGGLTSSNTSPTLSSGNTTPQFNAAVGRANTGKSGRVIDKLMGENDMLKRDLKVAQLNTDECRQATRMAEEKMETMASDYEAKLHQANITTSMLKRRDRQIEDLKGQLEGEKRKAQAAQQSEGYWKRELDETVSNTRERVQTAEQLAMLMEGRVLTMSNHWKEQGTEVNRTVGRLGKEIKSLVKDRQNDDKQIQRLNNLCEQQNEQLKKLVKEKEAIQQHFDEYKTFQEESLAKIKADTAVMEAHNIAITKTATETLGELRWALAVNKNLRAEPPE